jgi:hypothetical protein
MKTIREYINLVESAQTPVEEARQGQLPLATGTLKVIFVDPDMGAKAVGKASNPEEAKKIIKAKFDEMYDTGDRLRKVAPNIFVLEPDYQNTGERASADNYKHMYHWIIKQAK